MKIKHYDLFAGIGGFSLALDTIFHEQKNEHIFCEWEAFPTAVLKKHWPDATYYGDIADLVTDTDSQRRKRERKQDEGRHGLSSREVPDQEQKMATSDTESAGTWENQQGVRRLSQRHNQWKQRQGDITIVTGGFPCQPFSHAGRRNGTADDRYKWPEMFRVIQNVRPDWVIAENVRGLVTWNDGMVLETVLSDLEGEGYGVQSFIIPAVAVGAPHRRDRVWIVANLRGEEPRGVSSSERKEISETREPDTILATNPRHQRPEESEQYTVGVEQLRGGHWHQDWREVAFATCYDGVDDGLPRQMDGVTISASRHRKERLKACGNAIVPQVAMEIFSAIKSTYS